MESQHVPEPRWDGESYRDPLGYDEYKYQPLQYPDSIRLVALHPWCGKNHFDSADISDCEYCKLSIEIQHYRLGDVEGQYEALSYFCGYHWPLVELRIIEDHRPTLICITRRLEEALKGIRQRHQKVYLWVDALCINQSLSALDERGHQVRRMGDIFRAASNVNIWLGEESEDSDLAMNFIPKISVSKLDQLVTDIKTSQSWRALAILMRREWFTRRWIVQEVALARQAVLICGYRQVSWGSFSEAVTLFVEKADEIKKLFSKTENWSNLQQGLSQVADELPWYVDPFGIGRAAATVWPARKMAGNSEQFANLISKGLAQQVGKQFGIDAVQSKFWDEFHVGQIQGVGAHSLITTLDLILRKEPQGNFIPKRLCTMEDLLAYLPEFHSTMPQDTVFSIISLAKDSSDIFPDYRKSGAEVCADAIQHAISNSASLNIICRPWAPECLHAPTWIPQLSRLPFALNSEGTYVRHYADILIGLPGRCPYKASGSMPARAAHVSPDSTALTAKGLLLQKIGWIGASAENGTIPSEWVGSRGSTLKNQLEKEGYWRTLVANRTSQGIPPPAWYQRACDEVYENSTDNILNTRLQIQTLHEQAEEKAGSTKLVEFLTRVKAVTWNRRLVRLEDNSQGLVPGTTCRDDRICVLFGCDVPVVLRPVADGCWEFVGEAFVHGRGIMEGEAVNRGNEEVDFKIV